MTVLLIDGVGRVREYEITYLLPTIRIAIPVSVEYTCSAANPVCAPLPVAEFTRSDELSHPPVYRLAR